jgi:hypothetical protein
MIRGSSCLAEYEKAANSGWSISQQKRTLRPQTPSDFATTFFDQVEQLPDPCSQRFRTQRRLLFPSA